VLSLGTGSQPRSSSCARFPTAPSTRPGRDLSALELERLESPDGELGQLPGTCAHFVFDTDGTIHPAKPSRRRRPTG